MINLKTIFVVGFMCSFNTILAQTPTAIHVFFSPIYDSNTVDLSDSSFFTNDSNNLQIDVLKFYSSQFQFLKNGTIVLEEHNSFHLLDASFPKSLHITIENQQYIDFDQLNFNFGIDSIANVSGAIGGDLDPTKGMYWTWQSGYINFKLEGKSKLCTTRNNEFQFHLGGYQSPFATLQKLEFPIHNTQQIYINIDVKKIIEHCSIGTQSHVMSPNEEATLLSKKVSQAFTIK